ncbi:uncharacterized protein LOC124197754 isoform X2 [Daphnia pulex]|uniref:uncharacterized protein LOC124197754 isoform X2 n=1 Tax=Daphnia pulex TaxID=6669 RepID=UPI001EDF2EA7|nr:uncharacterized protein LOC124197754 isoform X2 [Daphnia pulex]
MNQNIKISHQLSVIKNILFLLLCGLICASHTSTIRAKSHISNDENFTKEREECKRAAGNPINEELGVALVETLKRIGTELVKYVENGDHEQTQLTIGEIKNMWKCLVLNEESMANSGESPESLKKYMAEILYFANDRNCKSPDETFFNGQCLPISTTKRSEYCDVHMGLYDDEKNKGICDCLELTKEQAKSELRPIYSDKTGFCHRQNTQGPCEIGEWFVLKNTSLCEPVPDGCPTDGRHVYWNPDNSTAKQCWEIWTRGPCKEGQLLHLAQDNEAQVYCSSVSAESMGDKSISNNSSCPPGTIRNQQNTCVTANTFPG